MANRNSSNKIRIKQTQKAKISLFSDGPDFRVVSIDFNSFSYIV